MLHPFCFSGHPTVMLWRCRAPHNIVLRIPSHAFVVAQMREEDAARKALQNCNRTASASGETCRMVFADNAPVK